ncbi:M96 mating-specific protein [Phytophthora megakarya]|uniref:M96 mating-specific protein n=1 Tax=Phytophthora megakarya TaxID=4795 RepID=A0A225W4P3_9STRA|nr:M96 mating-specific protein [Phytophthora megakarya]
MEDDDAKTLEEALSFLADCEASTEWLLGADAALDLVDLGLDDQCDVLDEDLQLPTLMEQPIPDLPTDLSPREEISSRTLSVDSTLTLSMGEHSPSFATNSPTSFSSSPTLVTHNPKSKKPKQPRKYSNRARDARREELVYLRQKVKDLQLQLDQLRNTHKPQTASAPFSSVAAPPSAAELKNARAKGKLTSIRTGKLSAGTPSATFSSVAAPVETAASPEHLAAVWGDMAQRQALERQKAERENVRLKLVLEKQIKMAKSLERILRKRQNERGILHVLGGSNKRIRRVSPAPGPDAARDDHADFDMLLSGIDKSRQELDAVFEANGLGRMETAYRTAKIEHDATRGMVMEIYANKIMPFDMAMTGKAVWRHFAHSMENMPHRTYYEKQPLHIETSDDTVVERYGLEMTDGHTNGDFHVKHIIRRYVEHDRIIIVWRTITDTVEFSAEPTPGIRFLEKGYIVIKPPATDQEDCTLMQTCYIIRPEFRSRNGPDQSRKVGALTDFVLSSVSGSISASHQMIENVLLSGVLRKHL